MSGNKKNKNKPVAVRSESEVPDKQRKATSKSKIVKPIRKKGLSGFFQRNTFQIALFLLCFVVFGNGIYNGYALDDEFYTNSRNGGNKVTAKGFGGLKEIFSTRTFYNNDGSGYSYRPVALATFAIETQFFGEFPHTSHFINVLLYALTMVLLFGLLRKWFHTQGDWFSFFVCLIYLVHPLHTEVVDNIKCRDELLAFLFAILAMRFAWKHIETVKSGEDIPLKKFLLPLSGLSFFLALLSKNTSIPFIAVLPLSIWFFTELGWKRSLLYVIPFIAAAAISIFIQRELLPPQSRTYQLFENPLPVNHGFAEVSATASYVLGRYLILHFIPHPLVYYYGTNYVPLVTWSNWLAIISLIVYTAIGIVALRQWKSKSIIAFGIALYLVTIVPYSNLIRPAPGLMAERFTYASTLGFSILLIWFVFHLLKRIPSDFRWNLASFKPVRNIFIGLFALMMIRCWFRNTDWADKTTLYMHDIAYAPESAKQNMLLGALTSSQAMEAHFKHNEAESKRLFMESREYYRTATTIAPTYHTAWSNLGTTYFFADSAAQALPYFLKAVSINKAYPDGLFNVGMAYDKLQKRDSAIYYFHEAIRCDSTYMSAYEQLARVVFSQQNDSAQAFALMRLAAKKKPDSDVPWKNMANFYLQSHDTLSAVGATEMAAKINPSDVDRLKKLVGYFQYHKNSAKYNYYMSILNEQQRIQKEKADAENEANGN
ncbi:MAG TPA: hypothetical protein VL651_09830 [Bacteroidia bacterium]|jgi:tetratricopeptide (TPR) repeat protein|nr:hypothetical protein [Bacteroidia bacterium]